MAHHRHHPKRDYGRDETRSGGFNWMAALVGVVAGGGALLAYERLAKASPKGPTLLPATGPGSPPPQDAKVPDPSAFEMTYTEIPGAGSLVLGTAKQVFVRVIGHGYSGPLRDMSVPMPVLWVAPDQSYVVVSYTGAFDAYPVGTPVYVKKG